MRRYRTTEATASYEDRDSAPDPEPPDDSGRWDLRGTSTMLIGYGRYLCLWSWQSDGPDQESG